MQPLADTLRRAPVPPGEAVRLAAALAEALAAKVREKARPPRITPGTVMIETRADGTLAVEFKSGALPAPSGPAGADERAAVQELGVICYRLLTGKPPIKGNVALIRDLETAVASAPQPDALKGLVLELISVDPSRRPGLEAAAERLGAIARGVPSTSTASVPVVPAPLPPPPRAGGAAKPPTPKSLPSLPAAHSPTPKPAAAPPPITSEPIAPAEELVPAAPVLPAEPVAIASTTRNKKQKNATDTQERLFFAEGERLAAEERADAAAAGRPVGNGSELEIEAVTGGAWWKRPRVLAAGAGGAVLLVILLYVAFGRSNGKKDTSEEEPLAAAAPTPEQPVDTAKVAAAPEPPAETPPAAAQPEPAPAAEPPPEPPAAEPEPQPEPPAEKPAPARKPARPAAKKPAKAPPPPPARPKEAPKPPPAATSSDPMAQARAARAKGRSAEAYSYYAKAASGKNAGAATFGMAEMAYAMKKYGDAISLAKKAMSKGANEKACWRIIARSHCARGEGRSAWFAFSKAGGGDCK
jgi:hypothetical protein